MAGRIFSYDDDSAPDLEYTTGSLIAILKAVLVDGYGTTASLGWTLEFSSGNDVAVFRMPSGTRTYIRVQDNLSAMYARVDAYETMSGLNDGISICPPPTETAYRYLAKGDNSYSRNRPWRIIGDEEGFYWFVRPNGSVDGSLISTAEQVCAWTTQYLGDYIPFQQEDKNVFMVILGKTTQDYCYFHPNSYSSTGPGFYLMRSWTNNIGNAQCVLNAGINSEDFFGRNFQSPIHGQRMYVRPFLIEADTVETANVKNTYWSGEKMIGFMPGLRNPICRATSEDQGTEESLIEFCAESFITEGSDIVEWHYSARKTTSALTVTNYQSYIIKLGDNFRI